MGKPKYLEIKQKDFKVKFDNNFSDIHIHIYTHTHTHTYPLNRVEVALRGKFIGLNVHMLG